MKVIFLDIDGVLNSHLYLSHTDRVESGIHQNIDPEKIFLLAELIQQSNAKVVLSSSWRMSFNDQLVPLDYDAFCLSEALRAQGISLYSKTAELKDQRGQEIRLWLSQHCEIDSFVILDDETYDWGELASHWVKTSYYTGLTEDTINAAKQILNAAEN